MRRFRDRAATIAILALCSLASTGCTLAPKRARDPILIPAPNSSPNANVGSRATNANRADDAVARTDFTAKVGAKESANVHIELGRLHESQGRFSAAAAEYQKAVASLEKQRGLRSGRDADEARALAHRRLAGAFDRLGRFSQSDIHYKAALKISPSDARIWNNAGYSYYVQGRWEEAEFALKKAASLDPNDPRILTNLGLTLAALGKVEEANVHLTSASGPVAAGANIGYVLASTGRSEEAKRYYSKAIEADPSQNAARSALEKLSRRVPAATPTALTSISLPPLPPPPPTRIPLPPPLIASATSSSDVKIRLTDGR